MTDEMNFVRQVDVFSPVEHGDSPIDVIGIGAVGSKVVKELVKTGFRNIRIWDADTVESHNVPNQAFGLNNIGQKKVAAMRDLIKLETGVEISIRDEFFTGQENLRKYVFLLVDSMKVRKEIWLRSIKMKLNVGCLIEARMGIDVGRVYTVCPMDMRHVKGWEDASTYDDSQVGASACGTVPSVGATSSLVAAIATWQLMKWLMANETVENEIIFSTRENFQSVVRKFHY